RQDRLEIEIPIGNVHGQYAVRLQLAEIQLNRLPRNQVNWNGVRAKCIQRDQGVPTRRGLLHFQARVPKNYALVRLAIRVIGKVIRSVSRKIDDRLVDVIEIEPLPWC